MQEPFGLIPCVGDLLNDSVLRLCLEFDAFMFLTSFRLQELVAYLD